MQRRKIFLLGVGCQKGGTTWLHDYLHSLPECDFGFAKEYHTFDARLLDAYRPLHLQNLRRLDKAIRKKQRRAWLPAPGLSRRIMKLSRLVMFCDSPTLYAEYFDRLWSEDRRIQLVGDITPEYSALERDHFREIRKLIEAKGFEIKVLLLMRDPVERCFAAARSAWEFKTRGGRRPDLDLFDLLKAQYPSPGYEARTRYDRIITTLESEFAPHEIHYGFYETLFCQAEIQRLLGFLGLSLSRRPNFVRRLNESTRPKEMPPDLAAQIREFYREAYAFCAERFGSDLIGGIWRRG